MAGAAPEHRLSRSPAQLSLPSPKIPGEMQCSSSLPGGAQCQEQSSIWLEFTSDGCTAGTVAWRLIFLRPRLLFHSSSLSVKRNCTISRVCTAHLSGALQAVSQHLWAAAERPVLKACPLLCPLPCFPAAGLVLTVLCLSSQVLGSRNVESPGGCSGAFFNESDCKVLWEILLSFGNVNMS